jgi:phosphoribosylformylglycinamidine cyclo-ligase
MASDRSLSYDATGVLDNTQLGLAALLGWVNKTAAFRREGQKGRRVVDVGFFASVVDIGNGLGLALCTDGVGSKVLIAEMLQRYDTIGIDCVAMNVNDVICVGAEPISFLDYIAIERATPSVLEKIAEGLYRGAELGGVTIVGGEISQIPDIIKGRAPGQGVDLVGMCAGIVPLDRIILGKEVTPGDVILGIRSSGIHSNGLTLARRALFDEGKLKADQYVDDLGCTVGEELLRPTHIYVRPVVDLLYQQHAPVRALVNVTSDGFLNLARIEANVGFRLDNLPEPQPIFDLIRRTGSVLEPEMYRVFNMGIGFCLILENEPSLIDAVKQTFAASQFEARIIGTVIADDRKRVFLPKQGLVGEGEEFRQS